MVVFYGTSHVVLWAIFVLHGGRVSEEFGTCPIKHMVICCPFYVAAWCLPVCDEICLISVNFVRSCITHRSTLVKFIARLWGLYSIFYGRFSSPAGSNLI